jgi:nitrite reductase/ring-hydroxylating ferredoxin subunit/uncharacterized membrane protein
MSVQQSTTQVPERAFTPPPPARPVLHRLAERISELDALDRPAALVAGVVRRVVRPGAVKNALSGTYLGHPLHPLLTDVPIGTWTSALLLDLFGGSESDEAAERLVAAGILAALPTAISGYSDWADTTMSNPRARRVGIVHAASNVTALALYSASFLARRRGRRGRGKALALAGAGALGAGGYLGGHLSYAEGVGVAQTAFERGPREWTPVIAEAELAEGKPASADAEGIAVLLVRHNGVLYALADRCSHRGGPLHEGELVDGCIQCPWHGSRFRLVDGSVQAGPASVPQPAFETRLRDGQIEVRRAHRS